MEIVALIDACPNLVAQLDAHRVGAAVVLYIIALAAVSVVVVALALTPRTALASHECLSAGSERGRRIDDSRQMFSSETRRGRQ